MTCASNGEAADGIEPHTTGRITDLLACDKIKAITLTSNALWSPSWPKRRANSHIERVSHNCEDVQHNSLITNYLKEYIKFSAP
jgi:hypothetical protein